MQDFGEGEVIAIETRAMGLERKASEGENQPPRSGLVQRHINVIDAYAIPLLTLCPGLIRTASS